MKQAFKKGDTVVHVSTTGFNWVFFFFPGIWLLLKRQYYIAIAVLVLNTVVNTLPGTVGLAIFLVTAIVLGLLALRVNNWLAARLIAAGYTAVK